MMGFNQLPNKSLQCAFASKIQDASQNSEGFENSKAAYSVSERNHEFDTKVEGTKHQAANKLMLAQKSPNEPLDTIVRQGKVDWSEPQPELESLVAWINGANLSWKAKSYSKSETEEPDESIRPDHAMLAQSRSTQIFNDDSQQFQQALADAQRYLKVPIDSIDVSEFPENFSWEDVGGYDFTGRVVDQKGCGSCYLMATIGMLESRIKIWFGKERHLSS